MPRRSAGRTGFQRSAHLSQGGADRHSLLIDAVVRHCVESVGDGKDPGSERDLAALQAERVTGGPSARGDR